MRLPQVAPWLFVSLFPFVLVASRANSQTLIVSQAANSARRLLPSSATATSHVVSLTWQASTSEDVVGYNVYRSWKSGGPYYKINHRLDPNTAFTDHRSISGRTYYYVTTAVNSAGQESTYSNEAEAAIP